MEWYFAPTDTNEKLCLICKKPIKGGNKGRDVSQEEFEKPDFQEMRDQIYSSERGVAHAKCFWKTNFLGSP